MGLFDWKNAEPDDEDDTITLVGWAGPEFEENLRASLDRSPATCMRCGEPDAEHCSECSACPDSHAGWCPNDPDNIAHAAKE